MNYPGAVYVVDTVPDIEGKIECVAMDGIHPSAYGNIVIARLVLRKLYELGLGENLDPVVNTDGIDQIPFSSKLLVALKEFFLRIAAMLKAF